MKQRLTKTEKSGRHPDAPASVDVEQAMAGWVQLVAQMHDPHAQSLAEQILVDTLKRHGFRLDTVRRILAHLPARTIQGPCLERIQTHFEL